MPSCPPMEIRNLVVGQQHQLFNGISTIEDVNNHIVAELHYAPWESKGMMDSIKKAFKWSIGKSKKKKEGERPKRGDDIHIKISIMRNIASHIHNI